MKFVGLSKLIRCEFRKLWSAFPEKLGQAGKQLQVFVSAHGQNWGEPPMSHTATFDSVTVNNFIPTMEAPSFSRCSLLAFVLPFADNFAVFDMRNQKWMEPIRDALIPK